MRKSIYILFCIVSIGTLFYQCRNLNLELSRDFWIYNNSGKPICYYNPYLTLFYPDTILPERYPKPDKVEKFMRNQFGEYGFHENDLFAMIPSDTISIFFFDPDTLAKYEWATIRQEYKILVRYDLSHNDLKKLKWRIYYPPTEVMKDMRMYPPYGRE